MEIEALTADHIPPEVLIQIFAFLSSGKELAVAGQVNKLWYHLSKEDQLWKRLCLNRFKLCRMDTFGTYREFYRNRIKVWHTSVNRILVKEDDQNIYTVKPDGTDKRYIVRCEPSERTMFQQPTWSSRADRVAFSSVDLSYRRRSRLITTDLEGNVLSSTNTTYAAFYLSFSEEGSVLSMLSNYDNVHTNGTAPARELTVGLWAVDLLAADHSEPKFVDHEELYYYCWCPLSAEPKFIAHVGFSRLEVISLSFISNQKTSKKVLVPDDQVGVFTAPYWLPTNDIVYATLDLKSKKTLLMLGQLVEPPTVEELKNKSTAELREMLESHKISTMDCIEKSDLIGKIQKEIIEKVVFVKSEPIGFTNRAMKFVCSKDGTHIAYQQDLTLKIINTAMYKLHKGKDESHYSLTIGDFQPVYFFWSPNGRYLLYLTQETYRMITYNIYDTQIQESYRVSSVALNSDFATNYLHFFCQYALNVCFFSPDSTHVVYCDVSSNPSVYVCNVAKFSVPVRIGAGEMAFWSPV